MDREIIRDYLKRSMFTDVQADALSRVFADLTSTFATKTDMADLKTELKTGMAELRTEMAELKTELKTEMADLKTELKTEMAGLKTELAAMETRMTWRIIGAMALLAALLTLLERFI